MKKIALVSILFTICFMVIPVGAKDESTLGRIKKVSQEKADALGRKLVEENANIKKLLKKGANPNVVLQSVETLPDDSLNSAFQKSLEKGIAKNEVRGDETPFMQILSKGDLATATLMLEAGADVNYQTIDSIPLLIHYLNEGNVEIATWLFITAKADTPSPAALFDGLNFPGVVASVGALDILKELKKRGEDITQTYNVQSGDTVASYTLLAMVIYADMEAKGLDHLDSIVVQRTSDMISWLLAEKCDINKPLSMGVLNGASLSAYPITLAAMSESSTIFNTLVTAGANLDVTTKISENGMNMSFDLSLIPLMNENPKQLITLLEKGANPNGAVVMVSDKGDTIANIPVLVFAVAQDNIEVAQKLKEAKADINRPIVTSAAVGITSDATTVIEFIAESKNDAILALFKDEIAQMPSTEEATQEVDSVTTSK